MDDSVKKLIMILEPLVSNLTKDKEYLEERKKELENVSRLLAYTKDNVEMVSVYADQDLILNNLSKIFCDKDEYKASCYLLKSDDENVKNLPQFTKARELIVDLIEYFKIYKSELIVETQDLKNSCDTKEIEKKYYDMFNSSNVYIDNIEEFKELLDTHDINREDKIQILLYTIKKNNEYYGIENN